MTEVKKSKLKDFWFGTQDIPSIIPGFILAVIIVAIAIFLTKTIGNAIGKESAKPDSRSDPSWLDSQKYDIAAHDM